MNLKILAWDLRPKLFCSAESAPSFDRNFPSAGGESTPCTRRCNDRRSRDGRSSGILHEEESTQRVHRSKELEQQAAELYVLLLPFEGSFLLEDHT